MLKKPILALSRDRSIIGQQNEICGDPEAWFDSKYFQNHDIYAASFDFFVDWKSESIGDEVWIKRISDSDNIQTYTESALIELISECDRKQKARCLCEFLNYHKIKEKYMLFRDVAEDDWKDGTEKVVEVDISSYKKDSISYYNASQIQEKIKALRKTPASIGKNGLIYATSSLEGYLSKQEYFWPGDVDTILFDNENKVIAVIEFKKHTSRSKIPFKDQKITNYLENDILKYKSIAFLRDRFQTKLYVVYYPIPEEISYIIVEEIVGTPDTLYASRRVELELPVISDESKMDKFASEFIEKVLGK